MPKTRDLGRALRGLLALGVAALFACSDSNGSRSSTGASARNTPLNWYSTTGTNTSTTGGVYTPLNWIDPNLGPIGASPGGAGDLTYGQYDPAAYPPSDPLSNMPVCTSAPQDANMANEEYALEGGALLYYASQVNAGGGGFGGGGQVNILPPFNSNDKIRTVARAFSKAMATGGTGMPGLAYRLDACMVQRIPGTEASSHQSGAGMTGQQAWNAMSGPIQAFITSARSAGWIGAGAWNDGAGNNHYDAIWLETSSGQVP
jgi:hypothetical protein